MIVSDARRAANRRNAQKSTGPITEAGKARSRLNALTHGLTADLPLVGPEADARRAERRAEWLALYAPRNGYEAWLVEELVGVSLKLGRVEVAESRSREVAAARAAGLLWEEDRRLEVERVAAGLPRRPERVVAQLRQSPQGCDWLIERWAALVRLAEASGGRGWTDEQTALAYDLLGTPSLSRSGPVGCPITEEGQLAGYAPDPVTLARTQIVALQTLRTELAAADEVNRALVEAGQSDLPNRELAALRRYERATVRRLDWLMTQIRAAGLQAQGVPVPVPAPVPFPHPVPAPADPAPAVAARNEAIPGDATDKTKPKAGEPAAAAPQPGPEPTLSLPASAPRRPDLAKLARRDQKRRRRSA